MGAIGEEERGFLLWVGRGGQHGVLAGGVEAEDGFGAGWFFNPQPLRADGDAAIVTDLDGRADAPHIIPPRAGGGGAQSRAFFLAGLLPGLLRRLLEFPVDFPGVAMRPQGVDLLVGTGDFRDLFAGKIGGEPALPVVMGAFDFAFGLRRGGIAEADVIELERPAQLRQGGGGVREEEAVVIHIDAERATVRPEGGGQKTEVGQEEFALIEL